MLKDEFLTEIFLMTGFMLIVIAGASYDMWKSADMIYARFSLTPFCRVSAYTFVCVCVCVMHCASHRHYKRSLKEWTSQALPCLSYDEENDVRVCVCARAPRACVHACMRATTSLNT